MNPEVEKTLGVQERRTNRLELNGRPYACPAATFGIHAGRAAS
jgi:hypothetical protein